MRAGLLRAWSLAVAAGLVNAACGDERPIPPAPLLADPAHPAPFTRQWLARPGQGFLGPLSLRGDTLVGSGYDRRLVAMTLAKGKTIWDYRLPGGASAGVVGSGDTIFAASDRPQGEVRAFERAHGRDIWKQRHTGRVATPLALVDSLVVVAPLEGGVLALHRGDGRILWKDRGKAVIAAPLPGVNGEIVVTTGDSLFRVSASDGKLRGKAKSPVPISVPWIDADTSVIVAGGDGAVAEIRKSDLSTVWRATLDDAVMVPPTLSHDTIWVATQKGTIYRIVRAKPQAEQLLSLANPISAAPTPWHDLVLVGMADGTLRAFDQTGAERWRIAVGGPLYTPPIPLPDGLLVLGGRGDIHRFVQAP